MVLSPAVVDYPMDIRSANQRAECLVIGCMGLHDLFKKGLACYQFLLNQWVLIYEYIDQHVTGAVRSIRRYCKDYVIITDRVPIHKIFL